MLFRPTVEDVIYLHEQELGATALVRDPHILAAAVEKPWQSVNLVDAYPTIDDKAAVIYEAISNGQPFVVGNKRTALLAVRLLYSFAGYDFAISTIDGWELGEYVATTRPVDMGCVASELARWRKEIPDDP